MIFHRVDEVDLNLLLHHKSDQSSTLDIRRHTCGVFEYICTTNVTQSESGVNYESDTWMVSLLSVSLMTCHAWQLVPVLQTIQEVFEACTAGTTGFYSGIILCEIIPNESSMISLPSTMWPVTACRTLYTILYGCHCNRRF